MRGRFESAGNGGRNRVLQKFQCGYGYPRHLVNIYCSKQKPIAWMMVGECALCAGNIVYRVDAIFQNGAIVSHSHSLNDAYCPHGRRPIGPGSVPHGHVNGREQ